MSKENYDKGLAVRREVLGSDYVERQLATADDFNRPLQDLLTEYCWGAVWARPQLPRKTHVRGALKNGCTKDEIREVLLQVAIYCGAPAGVEAFRLAREAFAEGEKRA